MKAICPISGVPFRTYDSLPIQWAVNHPVFSIPYEQLVILLDNIREQEEELILSSGPQTADNKQQAKEAADIKDLTTAANLAIHERNWKNPAFRLYQTKHLVLLAFMQHADLLNIDSGYCARPKPEIVDSHFWLAIELFSWACCLRLPKLKEEIPRYKITRDTERMDNLPEYLEEVNKIKEHIGSRFRSASEERKLAAWEQAIAILTRRREVSKTILSTSHNHLAAKWALTITNAPKDIWDFWFGILASPSTKITFDGVKVGDKWEAVKVGDLNELHDWMFEHLVEPKGEHNEYHRDDTEFYFMARQVVLDIIRTHLLILSQGSSSFKITNAAVGDDILNSSDDKLELKALEKGLPAKPKFSDFPSKVAMIKAMAAWRHTTKNALLEIADSKDPANVVLNKEEKGKYEIL